MHEILELVTAQAARSTKGPGVPQANPIATLRATHHILARAIAEGRGDVAAGRLAGYSPSTVAKLRDDPGFRELVAYYSAQVEDIFERAADRIAALGLAALDEIQDRLEREPGQFSAGQLLKVAEAMLDRSIAPAKGGPKSGASAGPTALSVNVQFVTESARPTLDLEATTNA